MSPSLLLLAILLAILPVLLGLAAWLKRRRHGDAAVAAAGAPPQDELEGEVRRFLEETPQLVALLEGLGYSPLLERDVRRILGELGSLVRVEIPDFDALRRVLDEIAGAAGSEPSEGSSTDPSPAPQPLRDDALLREVLAVRENRAGVLAILERAPLDELLPFVEQIPFEREGTVVWRSPVELTLIRKRPVDPRLFSELLEQLERRVRTAALRRPEAARDGVLEATARLRRALERDNAYLPAPLRALREELDAWLAGAPPEARRRRSELTTLLRRLLATRREYDFTAAPPPPTAKERAATLRTAAREQAQIFTRHPWMHGPPLTDLVLGALLAAELAPFPQRARGRAGTPAGVLARTWSEVASGCYDPEETSRRLHRLEDQGVWVHSLIFALLRLAQPPSVPPSSSAPRGRRRSAPNPPSHEK